MTTQFRYWVTRWFPSLRTFAISFDALAYRHVLRELHGRGMASSPGAEFFMASQPPSMVTTTTFDGFLSADFNAVTALLRNTGLGPTA